MRTLKTFAWLAASAATIAMTGLIVSVSGQVKAVAEVAASSRAKSDLDAALPASSTQSILTAKRMISSRDLAGKVVLLNMTATTCPSLCVVQMLALNNIIKDLPDDVRSGVHFVSVSIDPYRDDSNAMASFAKSLNLDTRRWSMAVYPVDRIEHYHQLFDMQLSQIANRSDTHAPEPPTALFLFSAKGEFIQRFDGQPVDQARLVREMKKVVRMTSDVSHGRTMTE